MKKHIFLTSRAIKTGVSNGNYSSLRQIEYWNVERIIKLLEINYPQLYKTVRHANLINMFISNTWHYFVLCHSGGLWTTDKGVKSISNISQPTISRDTKFYTSKTLKKFGLRSVYGESFIACESNNELLVKTLKWIEKNPLLVASNNRISKFALSYVVENFGQNLLQNFEIQNCDRSSGLGTLKRRMNFPAIGLLRDLNKLFIEDFRNYFTIAVELIKFVKFNFRGYLKAYSYYKQRELTKEVKQDQPQILNFADTSNGKLPMISCLMITFSHRIELAKESIICLENQMYPNIQLVLLEEGGSDIYEWIKARNVIKNVKFYEVKEHKTLGELRNLSIKIADGEYIAQWDDDDLSADNRLLAQYISMKNANSDGNMLARQVVQYAKKPYYAITNRRGWENTMLFRKSFAWRTQYPNLPMGEDTVFIYKYASKYKISLLDNPEIYVYRFHEYSTFGAKHFAELWNKSVAVYLTEKQQKEFLTKITKMYSVNLVRVKPDSLVNGKPQKQYFHHFQDELSKHYFIDENSNLEETEHWNVEKVIKLLKANHEQLYKVVKSENLINKFILNSWHYFVLYHSGGFWAAGTGFKLIDTIDQPTISNNTKLYTSEILKKFGLKNVYGESLIASDSHNELLGKTLEWIEKNPILVALDDSTSKLALSYVVEDFGLELLEKFEMLDTDKGLMQTISKQWRHIYNSLFHNIGKIIKEDLGKYSTLVIELIKFTKFNLTEYLNIYKFFRQRQLLREVKYYQQTAPKFGDSPNGGLPMISCLMVTLSNRVELVKEAIKCFEGQSYPNKQLVILEEGGTAIYELLKSQKIENVKYHRVNEKMILGNKRNLSLELADGEYVAQWDDDDLSANDRLWLQYNFMKNTDTDGNMLMRVLVHCKNRPYFAVSNYRGWEGTLLFKKSLALKIKYKNLPKGEDTIFAYKYISRYKVSLMDNPEMYVYRFHKYGTSGYKHFAELWNKSTDVYLTVKQQEELLVKINKIHSVGLIQNLPDSLVNGKLQTSNFNNFKDDLPRHSLIDDCDLKRVEYWKSDRVIDLLKENYPWSLKLLETPELIKMFVSRLWYYFVLHHLGGIWVSDESSKFSKIIVGPTISRDTNFYNRATLRKFGLKDVYGKSLIACKPQSELLTVGLKLIEKDPFLFATNKEMSKLVISLAVANSGQSVLDSFEVITTTEKIATLRSFNKLFTRLSIFFSSRIRRYGPLLKFSIKFVKFDALGYIRLIKHYSRRHRWDLDQTKINQIGTSNLITLNKGDLPLISCLMITLSGRAELAKQSIKCFENQSYPNKELLILEEGGTAIYNWLKSQKIENVKYHRVNEKMIIGDKRNLSLELANGEYYVTWDDDDLFSNNRLMAQYKAILYTNTEANLLLRQIIHSINRPYYAITTFRGLEGTMMFKRQDFTSIRYPSNMSKGEDTIFMYKYISKYRVSLLDAPELYIYRFHKYNTFDPTHFTKIWNESSVFYLTSQMQKELLSKLKSNYAVKIE